MEQWQIDFEWLRVRHFVKRRFGKRKLPDMQTILFLVGLQELGQMREGFEKEEKQDLIQLGAMSVLATKGYYQKMTRDPEGWPVYNIVTAPPKMELTDQTVLLKECVVRYFLDNGILEEE